ncbi:MAG: alkaline phosphatase family protein [Acidobacteriaceae bacterium]|jgi:phospholipase C
MSLEYSPPGLENLKHIVVVMMSGRSFDHMLGSLKATHPNIDGLTGTESNPDQQAQPVLVQPTAEYQGQLDPHPDTHFPAVDLQIFGGATGPNRVANMQGFVKSYFEQRKNSDSSRKVMNYFTPDKIPVLTTLATQYAVFNRWFASVPGSGNCNRIFAHFGTSFGLASDDVFYTNKQYPSIYQRLLSNNRTSKFFNFDDASSAPELADLMKQDPALFGTFEDFLNACGHSQLPDYCFVAPNYTDHDAPDGSGTFIATDQHPDHDVRAGEAFIATVYNSIRNNATLWPSTALLIVYDQHGGIYDHVPPPACTPDGFTAQPATIGTPDPFHFDRLGVRVPAVLVSPWIEQGSVINDTFEHASIPATVTEQFIGPYTQRTAREFAANTFLQFLNLSTMRADDECPVFVSESNKPGNSRNVIALPQTEAFPLPGFVAAAAKPGANRQPELQEIADGEASSSQSRSPVQVAVGPSTHVARDRWTIDDSIGHYPYAYAIYRFLTDPETSPPLAISIQAPWGGGKTSLMRMIQSQLDPDAIKEVDQTKAINSNEYGSASVKHILTEIDDASYPPAAQSARHPKAKASSESGSFKEVGGSQAPRTTIPPIEKPGERRVTVWFNAWKYESTAQVWAGLADCIVQQIGKRLGPVARELFWFRLQLRRLDAEKIRRRISNEIFSAFIRKLLAWLPAYIAGLGVASIAMLRHAPRPAVGVFFLELIAGCTQFWKARSETEKQPARISLGDFIQAPDYAANLGFVHEVVEDLRRVFQLIPKKHLPMVVFIDDLDRCSPGKIAAVVEAINLFLAGEFPECMFILGIDDEMVAAALDTAHSDVIAKLPRYVKSTSIGWRFMDKFVQLPFVIPPPTRDDLARYVESLLSQGGVNTSVSMQVRDNAARAVEAGSLAVASPEQVVAKLSSEQKLAPGQKETLQREVKIIQGMNESIKDFTDQDKGIRDAISQHANRYFDNPRDTKRFVNLFRFYYFLRAAREARGQLVPSVDQLCRWIAFSLRWPEVGRWLRTHPVAQDDSGETVLVAIDRLSGANHTHQKWQLAMDGTFGLKIQDAGWLGDEDLHAFLRREAVEFQKEDRLSACSDKGLW